MAILFNAQYHATPCHHDVFAVIYDVAPKCGIGRYWVLLPFTEQGALLGFSEFQGRAPLRLG